MRFKKGLVPIALLAAVVVALTVVASVTLFAQTPITNRPIGTICDRYPTLPICKRASPTPIPTPVVDSDSDGFSDVVENYLGTDPKNACGPSTWPPDVNDDKTVNSTDLDWMGRAIKNFSAKGFHNKRYDLNTDGKINITDRSIMLLYSGKSCGLPTPSPTINPSPGSTPTPSPLSIPVSNLQVTSSCDSGNLRVSFHWQNDILSTNHRFLDINSNPWVNEDEPQPWGTKFQLGDSFVWSKDTLLDQGDVDLKTVGNQLGPAENMAYYWRILAGDENIKYPPVYPSGTTKPPGIPFSTASCSK